jgi:hypothetical protein
MARPAWVTTVYTQWEHPPTAIGSHGTTVYDFRLGTRKKDAAGNEYVFLQGVASTVDGSLVSFGLSTTNVFQSALSVTGVRGPVAIANAIVDTTAKAGWYQIYGLSTTALYNGAAVANAKVYSASTGKIDDAVVSGDQIDGAVVGTTVSGSGAGAVYLSYPFMNGAG